MVAVASSKGDRPQLLASAGPLVEHLDRTATSTGIGPFDRQREHRLSGLEGLRLVTAPSGSAVHGSILSSRSAANGPMTLLTRSAGWSISATPALTTSKFFLSVASERLPSWTATGIGACTSPAPSSSRKASGAAKAWGAWATWAKSLVLNAPVSRRPSS